MRRLAVVVAIVVLFISLVLAKVGIISETSKFWSSECREKVYFRYAESRQNSPKGQNLRVKNQHRETEAQSF